MYRTLCGIVALSFCLAANAQEVPRPAMDYPVTTPDGKEIKVSQLKGKPAIIEFLLTTCPHCQHTAEVLSKLQKEWGPRVQIVGVAMNDNPDVPGFIKEHSVTFPVGTGPRANVYDFLQHSVMNPRINFPQLIFIDKNGVIQAQHGGEEEAFFGGDQEKSLRAEVQKILTAAPAAKAHTAPKKKA